MALFRLAQAIASPLEHDEIWNIGENQGMQSSWCSSVSRRANFDSSGSNHIQEKLTRGGLGFMGSLPKKPPRRRCH